MTINASQLLLLRCALERFQFISSRWEGTFLMWISEADGFMEIMTLDDNDSTSAFLLSSIIEMLSTLPLTASDDVFLTQFSENCEILYMHAQLGNYYWNSTQMSFNAFCRKYRQYAGQLPSQLMVDVPHADAEHVKAWLEGLLY